MNTYKYELREIDALMEDENIWYWNTSYNIGTFTTKASDHKQAFLRAIHKLGITCKRGKCYVTYDGDVYELRNRKTDEPLLAAIPMF